MKNFISTIAIIICFATVSFAQAEQTIIKSLAVETAVAVLDLPGEVNTSLWDKDFIRITATIKTTNQGEEILKKLILVGRYDILSAEVDGQFVITMPKVSHQVVIKGVELTEVISYEVQLPYHVKALVKKGAVVVEQAM
jgi:hypothetical protein